MRAWFADAAVAAAQADERRLGRVFFVALATYLAVPALWVVRMYGTRYDPTPQEGL